VSKDDNKIILNVMGMKSNSCRERVTEALARVDGVQEVWVSLVRAQAVVTYVSPCQQQAMKDAVARSGYGVSINHAQGGPCARNSDHKE
jgi:copper chaperone CopZ